MAAVARPQFFIDFGSLGKGKGLQHPFVFPQPLLQPAAAPATQSKAATTPTATPTRPAGAVADEEQPLELTPRYNQLPWTFSTERLYILYMVPPAQAPTPTAAYANFPPLQGFVGGQSYLSLITYSDSAIGSYNELMYISGAYNDPATCSSNGPTASIDRIWVDSRTSRRAGRNIWGIPKEIATFTWQSSTLGYESVSVSDAAGNLILQATFKDFPALPGFLLNTAFSFAKNLIPIKSEGVQWPIMDPVMSPDQVDPATVPVYATARTAFKGPKPIRSKIAFDLKGAEVKKLASFTASSDALLGRSADVLRPLVPLAVKLQSGAQSSISAPEILSC